jgi:indole-3-glycerol phosphate synthase
MFLDEILQHKQAEVAARKQEKPLDRLEKELERQIPAVRPFKPGLVGDSIGLIAEIKKASPSKGLLCRKFDPVKLAGIYESAGASAISVLTDQRFFQGSLDYLRMVKEVTRRVPVLRKDFLIDRYQLVEARLYGADAVLLIVAALTPVELATMLREAEELDLTPLVEVHDAGELKVALDAGAEVIGINNRDLKSFQVSLETTYQLLKLIPPGKVVVSESGISNRDDLLRLAGAGVNAVLVGESIVTAPDPGKKIRELMGETAS